MRAYGRWGIRIDDPVAFLTQIVGTVPEVTDEAIDAYFGAEIVQHFSQTIASLFIDKSRSIFHANGQLSELATATAALAAQSLQRFGVRLDGLNIERISIPAEELKRFQEVLGKRMEIDQISKADVGEAYRLLRSFDVLDKAASAGGAGGVAAAMGLGTGIEAGRAIGKVMRESIHLEPDDKAQPSCNDRLHRLKSLLDEGLISSGEYEDRRRRLIEEL